jgi:hypothetical protein
VTLGILQLIIQAIHKREKLFSLGDGCLGGKPVEVLPTEGLHMTGSEEKKRRGYGREYEE